MSKFLLTFFTLISFTFSKAAYVPDEIAPLSLEEIAISLLTYTLNNQIQKENKIL